MRVLFDGPAFPPDPGAGRAWEEGPGWSAGWIAPSWPTVSPGVLDWLLELELPTARTLRLHVSADERYLLQIDGRSLGEGPERCDLVRWAYETYDLELGAGRHRLEVRTWTATPQAPWAQSTLGPALLVAPGHLADCGLVATGQAPWRVRPVPGRAWS